MSPGRVVQEPPSACCATRITCLVPLFSDQASIPSPPSASETDGVAMVSPAPESETGATQLGAASAVGASATASTPASASGRKTPDTRYRLVGAARRRHPPIDVR